MLTQIAGKLAFVLTLCDMHRKQIRSLKTIHLFTLSHSSDMHQRNCPAMQRVWRRVLGLMASKDLTWPHPPLLQFLRGAQESGRLEEMGHPPQSRRDDDLIPNQVKHHKKLMPNTQEEEEKTVQHDEHVTIGGKIVAYQLGAYEMQMHLAVWDCSFGRTWGVQRKVNGNNLLHRHGYQ